MIYELSRFLNKHKDQNMDIKKTPTSFILSTKYDTLQMTLMMEKGTVVDEERPQMIFNYYNKSGKGKR